MSTPRAPLEANLRLVALFQALAFGYAIVPFLWFLVRERGLGFDDYAGLQSVYYVTTLVAELPTGLLADRIGRKPVLALAAVSQAAGFCAIAEARGFLAFAAAQTLLGLGQAMLSGTTSALLFDSLRALGREGEFLRLESRAVHARLIGSSAAFLLGGLFASRFGLASAAWVSAALSGAALLPALRIAEPAREHSGAGVLALVAASLRDVARVPDLRWAAVLFASLFVALRTAFHFYPPGLERAGLGELAAIGAIFAGLNVVAATSVRAAPRLNAAFGARPLLVSLLALLALSFGLLGVTAHPAATLLCFTAQQVPFGLHFPLVAAFVNPLVPSARRATLLSCLSLAGRASFALAFPLFGAVVDRAGLPAALGAAAGVFAATALLLSLRR